MRKGAKEKRQNEDIREAEETHDGNRAEKGERRG
jgi:hypothetical protein